MKMRTYIFALLLSCFVLGLFSGCTSTKNVLVCMGGDPMGSITIAGMVTDYTLEKELC